MLKKKYRLNLSIRLENPKILKNSLFTLLVSKNDLQQSRFGFIVTKKNDKRAVIRNRAKRTFARYLQLTEVKPGWDMIFIIKQEALNAKKEEVERVIEQTLKKGSYL